MPKRFLHKSISLALLFFLKQTILFSQSGIEPSKLKQFNITINFDDYTVKTQMLSQDKNICVNKDLVYMWYGSQRIIETRGGYDGKLLHGTYRAFYLNNQLKEQGQVKYGLRHREWKYWYADGKLREVINWKNGKKNGAYFLYNDYGQLMAKGNFKEDKLHGNFFTYGATGKITDKKKYRGGEEVPPKIKTKSAPKEKPGTKKESKKVEPKVDSKTKTPILKRLFKKKSAKVGELKRRKENKKMITT